MARADLPRVTEEELAEAERVIAEAQAIDDWPEPWETPSRYKARGLAATLRLLSLLSLLPRALAELREVRAKNEKAKAVVGAARCWLVTTERAGAAARETMENILDYGTKYDRAKDRSDEALRENERAKVAVAAALAAHDSEEHG